MEARIVILGGWTGGTLAANRLRKLLAPSDAAITVLTLTIAMSANQGWRH